MNADRPKAPGLAAGGQARSLLFALALWAAAGLALPHAAVAAAASSPPAGLRQTVLDLASFGDRSTASQGGRAAAAYIAQRFEKAGAEEQGEVDFPIPSLRQDEAFLTAGDRRIPLHPLRYNAITPQNLPAEGLTGPLLYVGRGDLADFNGMAVAGAVVLMEFDSGRNWLNAAALGASGLIYLNRGPSGRDLFLDKEELSPLQFPCYWVDSTALAPLLSADQLLNHKELHPTVTITGSAQWQRQTARNLYALFPGTDKDRTNELLLVEAFYDTSSFLAGKGPGADEGLSIAALLELADHLHRHPPRRPFLLVATDAASQGLAGMREFIWTATTRAKDLRDQEKQYAATKKERQRYLTALQGLGRSGGTPGDGPLLQKALDEPLKLTIDQLSTRLIDLRMQASGGERKEEIAALAAERLLLRRLGWRSDFDRLTDEEWTLLAPLIPQAIEKHSQVLAEVEANGRMLTATKRLRALLGEYEPRAVVSLHLSSHGSGLGAFEQGFLYPLRPTVNRTTAFRTLDEVLQEAAAKPPPDAPPFVSTLRPNRLQPWQELLPDRPHLGGEVSCLAGLPGITLATTGDLRSSWGTPFDTPDRIDWPAAAGQWQLARHLIEALDRRPVLPPVEIRNGFASVSGKTKLLLQGELFAEHPAAGAVLLAFQGKARYLVRTDQQGAFQLKGMADKRHVQDKVILEGYAFSPVDGTVHWAIDKKLTGKSSYRVKMDRQDMQTELVMFNCTQSTLFNLLEPRSLRYMTKLQLIDGRSEAPPIRHWYSRIDTRSSIIASIYLEPGSRLKLTLSDSVLNKKMILTNGDGDNPMGAGYEVTRHPSLYHTSYRTARDIWALLDPRIDNLERHGIHNERIKELAEEGKTALKAAADALAGQRYDRFSEESNLAWALATRVYDQVEKTQKDVLFGVLFYIALFVPFAFCMERLLFSYVSIYRRIIAFSLILCLVIALISQVHPAFELAYSPTVVILAFFIIGLSLLVTVIIAVRFEDEMILLQRRATHKRPAEISSWKAFLAAFFLGVSNLRRRRLRTGLTCLTLVILTFTIMSFTTVKSIRRQNKLHFADQASYQGFFIRDMGWKDLPTESLTVFRTLFNGKAVVGPRVWLSGDDPTRPASIRVTRGDQSLTLQGLTGLDPAEPAVSGMDAILVQGRWFRPDEPDGVLIPESLATRLKIDLSRTDQPPLLLWGKPLRITGIYSERLMQRFTDLDGEIPTPVIYPSESMKEMSEVEQEALESGEDVVQFQGRYQHIGPDQVLILPARTLLRIGGRVKGVALKGAEGTGGATGRQLSDRFNLTIFSGEVDGVFVYNASETISYSGMPNVIIPMLISVLIVLNTMISSVYERKREIGIYTSVGLAPSHVAFLFIAEALALAVLSVVLGYLLAQTCAGLLAATPRWQGITVNYSSTAGVAAMLLVMGVVLLSVIYPARVAASIAIPDVHKSWKLPPEENDAIAVTLPFLMRYDEHASICGFLYTYLKGHQDVSHGIFSTGPIEVIDMAARSKTVLQWLPLADNCLHLRTKVWLAPFDFGIMQWVDLRFCHASEGRDFLEIHVTMTRRAGESTVWRRVNTSFLHALRKQLLVWRSLDEEGHAQYRRLLPQPTPPLEDFA